VSLVYYLQNLVLSSIFTDSHNDDTKIGGTNAHEIFRILISAAFEDCIYQRSCFNLVTLIKAMFDFGYEAFRARVRIDKSLLKFVWDSHKELRLLIRWSNAVYILFDFLQKCNLQGLWVKCKDINSVFIGWTNNECLSLFPRLNRYDLSVASNKEILGSLNL
jgi:hypothetical protein